MADLSVSEIHALNEALDDEYHAWATYNQVIADLGAASAFSYIRATEAPYIFGH